MGRTREVVVVRVEDQNGEFVAMDGMDMDGMDMDGMDMDTLDTDLKYRRHRDIDLHRVLLLLLLLLLHS